jgi:hypothetical protein
MHIFALDGIEALGLREILLVKVPYKETVLAR